MFAETTNTLIARVEADIEAASGRIVEAEGREVSYFPVRSGVGPIYIGREVQGRKRLRALRQAMGCYHFGGSMQYEV